MSNEDVQVHYRTKGDTLTPIAAKLEQTDENGVLQPVNLNGGFVPKFRMVDDNGVTKVAETEDNVTVTDAANGKVQYDFQTADVNTAGTFWAWFAVYDSGGTERDSFPVSGKKLRVEIADAFALT